MRSSEWKPRPWCLLERKEGRALHSEIKESIRRTIEGARTEVELLEFLSGMAYFCFELDFDCGLITKEFRLGADYRVDFLIAQDGFSRGNAFILVEAESPTEKPYTSGGNPSGRLNHALQQIRDWRRWIMANRDEAQRVFPSTTWRDGIEPNFEYRIIIGREQDFQGVSSKITQLSRENNVEIRPFDHLLHAFERKHYRTFLRRAGHSEAVQNILASPFRSAYSDTHYREIMRAVKYGYHLMSDIALEAAERAICGPYLDEFDRVIIATLERPRQDFGEEADKLFESFYLASWCN